MPSGSRWDLTPRQSVEQECGHRGTRRGGGGLRRAPCGPRRGCRLSCRAIGGPAAAAVLGPHPHRDQRYFLRVWAAGALLYAWDDTARDAVVAALADESWRVREMAAKVVARRRLGAALSTVAGLQHDPVPRVRAAAARALAVVTVTGA